MSQLTTLKHDTGITINGWRTRLSDLYEEAKARNGGNSLSIYADVTQLLDYLERLEDVPEGLDLVTELNNLAGRLRRA